MDSGENKRESLKNEDEDEGQEDEKDYAESKVSKRLSDLTTKRVIIIVLLLLFIIPLLSADYYFDLTKPLDYSIKLIRNMC